MEIQCIVCGNTFNLRGGVYGQSTKRCGKCYLEWKKEIRRKKNDKKMY